MDNRENRMITRRDPNGHFAVGVSGNPGGRPKGLASIIRDRTFDGQELVDFYTSVFRGEKIDGVKPTLKLRMEAATWLTDRGFGKPMQSIQMAAQERSNDPLEAFNGLTKEELLAMYRGEPLHGDVIVGDARVIDNHES
jgi:hypothetical protein